MVDKDKKELTDKDLEKATGGTDDRRPVLKRGHTNVPAPDADDPVITPTPTTSTPRARPGGQVSPV